MNEAQCLTIAGTILYGAPCITILWCGLRVHLRRRKRVQAAKSRRDSVLRNDSSAYRQSMMTYQREAA